MEQSSDPERSKTKDLLLRATRELGTHGVDTPALDAEVLLAHVLHVDRLHLYLLFEDTVDDETRSEFERLVGQRLKHKPVAYLTGHKEFMSLDFAVDEGVLIPRPETEILVETVCDLGSEKSDVLELGTGSGAISVSLAKYKPDWRILATDLSMKCLLVARENARLNGVSGRIAFLQADLMKPFMTRGSFDWIVSNPPYICQQDISELPVGIRKYEPRLALDGGNDGLKVITQILLNAHRLLKPGGQLALEIGYGQSEKVQSIARETGYYEHIQVKHDYSGIPRVFHCVCQKNENYNG